MFVKKKHGTIDEESGETVDLFGKEFRKKKGKKLPTEPSPIPLDPLSAWSSKGTFRRERNLYVLVQLPDQEDPYYIPDIVNNQDDKEAACEWWAENIVSFVNETQLAWSVVTEENEEFEELMAAAAKDNNNLYPQGVSYKWQDTPGAKPLQLNIVEYVERVFEWCHETFQDERLFPTDEDVAFPDDFEKAVKKIFRRVFRVWAIVYSHECLHKKPNFHTHGLLKHFLFFGWFWNLFDVKEMKVVDTHLAPYRASFKKQQSLYKQRKLPLLKKDMAE